MKRNILYRPLTGTETAIGCLIAPIYLGISFVWGMINPFSPGLGIALAAFALILVIFHRFWKDSLDNITLTGLQLLWKPVLAWALSGVICTVFNDILLLSGVSYFVSTEWGPTLWDVRAYVLTDTVQNQFWLTALTLAILLPVVEEFLFRGVIFGSIYPKSHLLAAIISTALFAAFHTLRYIGSVDDLYLPIYFFQYIPRGLFLCWLYTSTESIYAPILMHLLCNIDLLT